MTSLFVECDLCTNVLGFCNASILHDKIRKLPRAARVETLVERILVCEEDRVSMWLWREPNIHIFLRFLVLDRSLLGIFPFIHFQMLHHTHGLIRREDDSAMTNKHRFLHFIVEQVRGSQFGHGSFILGHGVLCSFEKDNDPIPRLTATIPFILGNCRQHLVGIYILGQFASSRHECNLAEPILPSLSLGRCRLLVQGDQLGTQINRVQYIRTRLGKFLGRVNHIIPWGLFTHAALAAVPSTARRTG
mmetsp:Transcript_5776/g.13169  ORF Transcript_5776/g.13169 Transcript_5776/m.13169 type:complete len:247 (-) Transcript_5776:1778-2518(-)